MMPQSRRRTRVAAGLSVICLVAVFSSTAAAQSPDMPPLSTADLAPGTDVSAIESGGEGLGGDLPPTDARYIVVLEDDIEHPGTVAAR